MTRYEIAQKIEELSARRAALESRFPPEWRRDQWYDDPEYARLCLQIVNLKAALGFHPFGKRGKR